MHFDRALVGVGFVDLFVSNLFPPLHQLVHFVQRFRVVFCLGPELLKVTKLNLRNYSASIQDLRVILLMLGFSATRPN